MKLLGLFLILIVSEQAGAQLMPLGLYEGLMGNSGVATTHSTAASYYNPSLLRQRKDNAFSINGNTVGTSESKTGDSTLSNSLSFSPSFLSDIIVGADLVHEFFLATTLQGQFNWQSTTGNNSFDSELNLNRVVTGYSMAFKSIPLALQVLGRYSEARSFGVAESNDTVNNVSAVSKVKTEFRNFNVALGISTHLRFDYYTLGVNFNTRGISLYNKDEGTMKSFIRGPGPTDYRVVESNSGSATVAHEDGKLSIGHGFKDGNHEFLTDSLFMESSDHLDKYDFIQTFGYRYGLADSHQVLCGIGHLFGPDVKYFGQSFNASVGYSWTTRLLRSAFGLYYSRSDTTTDTSTAGVIFGAEYEY